MENTKLPITLVIAPEVLQALDRQAEEEYRSRSNMATKILAQGLGLARTEAEAKAQ